PDSKATVCRPTLRARLTVVSVVERDGASHCHAGRLGSCPIQGGARVERVGSAGRNASVASPRVIGRRRSELRSFLPVSARFPCARCLRLDPRSTLTNTACHRRASTQRSPWCQRWLR